MGLDLLQVGEEIAMGEAGRLRRAGCTGGQHQHGIVVLVARDDGSGLTSEELFEGLGGVETDALGNEHPLDVDSHAVDARERVAPARSDDGEACAGPSQLTLKLY